MSETKPSAELSIAVLFATVSGWVKYLLSKWMLFMAIGFVCALLGILYAWVQKPVYTSELTFAVEDDGGSTLSAYSGIAAQFGLDLGGGGGGVFSGENLIELMKSKMLVEKTLFTRIDVNGKKQSMLNYYVDTKIKGPKKANTPIDDLNYPDNYVSGNNRFQDSILNKIVKSIIKDQLLIDRIDKKLSIISLRFKDGDELFAKTFVENLAKTVIQFYVEYRSKKSRQNVEILQRQTDSVNNLITYGIGSIAATSDLNVNPVRQVVRIGTQRRQVDLQVNGALYGELLKNLELSKISMRKQMPLIQIIDTPVLPLEKKKPGRLLTGILFAFLGCGITAIYLLLRRHIKYTTVAPAT